MSGDREGAWVCRPAHVLVRIRGSVARFGPVGLALFSSRNTDSPGCSEVLAHANLAVGDALMNRAQVFVFRFYEQRELRNWFYTVAFAIFVPVGYHFADRSEEHTSELQSPCNLV